MVSEKKFQLSQSYTNIKQYPNYVKDLNGLYGFDTLNENTQNELHFCKEALKFFRKRIEIEEIYAKSLAKLAQQKREFETSFPTLADAWNSVLDHTMNLSVAHSAVATQMSENLASGIQSLLKDMEATRKQLVIDSNNLNSEYNKTVESLKKAKGEYEKACKEADGATANLQKAEQDPKKKDVSKLEKESEKKAQQRQTSDEFYKSKVNTTNQFIDEYYKELMPSILNGFEHHDTVRNHMMKEILKRYTQIFTSFPPVFEREAEAVKDKVDAIDNEKDIVSFVEKKKTGLSEIREVFQYEPYVQQAPSSPRITRKLTTKIFRSKSPTGVSRPSSIEIDDSFGSSFVEKEQEQK